MENRRTLTSMVDAELSRRPQNLICHCGQEQNVENTRCISCGGSLE